MQCVNVSVPKIIIGFLILFVFCQLPEAAQYYYKPNLGLFVGLGGLFIAVAYLVARWQGYTGLQAWGLQEHSGWSTNLGLGLLSGIGFSLLAFTIALAFKVERLLFVPNYEEFIIRTFVFATITLIPSIAEDIVTRSYLQRHLSQKLRPGLFIIISSAVFALNHIYPLHNGLVTWIFLLIVGVNLAIPLVIGSSLWLTLGIHWGISITYQVTNHVMTTQSSVHAKVSSLTILCICLAVAIPFNLWLSMKAAKNPLSGIKWKQEY